MHRPFACVAAALLFAPVIVSRAAEADPPANYLGNIVVPPGTPAAPADLPPIVSESPGPRTGLFHPKPIEPPPITWKPGVTPIIINGTLVYDYETNRLNRHKIPKGPVRMWWDYVRSPQHQAEPDGIYTPVGNCSFWTEFWYTYGSSRMFFGSAESAPVHRQFFNPELPPGYILRAWHPRKYGHVE